jgi:hypothetical protein
MDSEMEVSEDSGWRLPDRSTAMIKLRDAALVAATIALLLYAATTVARHAAATSQPAPHVALAHCAGPGSGACDKP